VLTAISLLTFSIPIDMKIGFSFILFLLIYPLCGCPARPESPADVRERAANATAELKRDTKAVAQGVREGWTRDKSVDINAASKEELQALPGVTPRLAENIVTHRPYAKTSELVEKRVMPKPEYDRVADRLTAKR
jgi:Helix-hairpin-helix motif